MTATTIIATVRDYGELMAGLRARADALKTNRRTLDEIAGLTPGHSSKLLAPVPIKNFGPDTIGPMLGALGLKLLIVEDVEALARLTKRLGNGFGEGFGKRNEAQVRDASMTMRPRKRHKHQWKDNADWSRVMNSRRTLVMSDADRRKSAKHAAHMRWKRKGRKAIPLDGPMTVVVGAGQRVSAPTTIA